MRLQADDDYVRFRTPLLSVSGQAQGRSRSQAIDSARRGDGALFAPSRSEQIVRTRGCCVRKRSSRAARWTAVLLCCAAGAPAFAQSEQVPSPDAPAAAPAADPARSESVGGRTIYQAAYFRAFSPSNALEIVERVPGFSLDLGAQDVRGFGQAAGNVVINGSRPSSKSDTLATVLARIPASRVARVEVGPGDLFGSEFSGKPQVLNLVTTAAGGLAGTVNASLARTYDGRLAPAGSVSV